MTDGVPSSIRGLFRMSVAERGGGLWWIEEPNLVLSSMRGALARAAGGDAASVIALLGVGTAGTAPDVGDIALTDAVTVPIASVSFPSDGAVRFHWRLPTSAANGMSIMEWGLLTAGGTLVARKVRSTAVEKTSSTSLEGEWTITL